MVADFRVERPASGARDSLVVNERGVVQSLDLGGQQIFGNTEAMARLTHHNGLGDQLDGEPLRLHFARLDPQRLYASMRIGHTHAREVASRMELTSDGFQVVRSVQNLSRIRSIRAAFPVVTGVPLTDEERGASFKLHMPGRDPIVIDSLASRDDARSRFFVGSDAMIDLGGRQISLSSQTILEGDSTRAIGAPESRVFVRREHDALFIGPAACDELCRGVTLQPNEALVTGATFTFNQA